MKKQILIRTSVAAIALLSHAAYALEIGKAIITPVVVTKAGSPTKTKNVALMNIKLSHVEMRKIMSYKPDAHDSKQSMLGILPQAINLGMNNVPVLDQGMYGTCVTFAVTAAVDAVLGKGDYVSQLCNLTLGSYLEEYGYKESGWNGTFAPAVFEQMTRFGIVNKDRQRALTCGGLTEYPNSENNYFDSEPTMTSIKTFNSMSEDVSEKFYALEHLNAYQRFEAQFSDTDQAEKVLAQVKSALTKGNRLTVGVLLMISPYCSAAACATHNSAYDTWANTKELEYPPNFFGGHEMVVTGFDDKAIAIEKNGTKHRGLLTLRNSWGTDVGDNGDYYMTYDFFKKYVMEVNEIKEIIAD